MYVWLIFIVMYLHMSLTDAEHSHTVVRHFDCGGLH